jgi:hypothetical protein
LVRSSPADVTPVLTYTNPLLRFLQECTEATGAAAARQT